MSWHEFLVLESAQPAGTRIEIDHSKNQSEHRCDFCRRTLGNDVPRIHARIDINTATEAGYEHAAWQLDSCTDCGISKLRSLAAAALAAGHLHPTQVLARAAEASAATPPHVPQ